MACLAYAPSRVAYRGTQMQREQLLDLLEKLIGACNAGAHREGTGLPAIVERELRIINAGSVVNWILLILAVGNKYCFCHFD